MGIGNGVLSDMCESIAQAGGGMTVYVKQGEPLTGKCSRLVRAARTPEVKINVVWGMEKKEKNVERNELMEENNENDDDFKMVEKLPINDNAGSAKEFTPSSDSPVRPLSTSTSAPISLFDTSDALDVDAPTSKLQSTGPPPTPPKPSPTLPLTPRIQQTPLPSHIPSIFPGTRTQVYAIVHTPKEDMGVDAVIKEIKVRGVVTTTGDLVELVVPVSKVLDSPLSPFDTMSTSLFIHTLAAKALIKDREQGTHAFPSSVSVLFEGASAESSINDPRVKELKDLKEAYLKKDIVQLGKEYCVTSQYTSFIAVDGRRSSVSSGKEQTGTLDWIVPADPLQPQLLFFL
ncbi:hypothetical protein F5051DRAFT_433221 [Lentinula edodes]|nr:hypothetical protein F5051DRAFT_433221 [Lentinula edodes]